ncbi:hypothetical protein [Isoalcanivorax beigongshangi]|uniref:Uncharacterized protein n=1 Tax=Isoalcanivorax beigongshangi TaxID=3238810 RepID=A0ABV4ALE3_9GAMM
MTVVRLLLIALLAWAPLAQAGGSSALVPQTAVSSEPPPEVAAGAHTSIPNVPVQNHRQALPSSFRLNPDSGQPPSDPYLSVLIFLLVIQCSYWMLRFYPQLRRFFRSLLSRSRRSPLVRRHSDKRRPAALPTPPR